MLVGLGDLYIPAASRSRGSCSPDEFKRLTSDPLRLQRVQDVLKAAPWLGLGSPTLNWVQAAARSIMQLNAFSFPASIRVPLLIIAAGNDTSSRRGRPRLSRHAPRTASSSLCRRETRDPPGARRASRAVLGSLRRLSAGLEPHSGRTPYRALGQKSAKRFSDKSDAQTKKSGASIAIEGPPCAGSLRRNSDVLFLCYFGIDDSPRIF